MTKPRAVMDDHTLVMEGVKPLLANARCAHALLESLEAAAASRSTLRPGSVHAPSIPDQHALLSDQDKKRHATGIALL